MFRPVSAALLVTCCLFFSYAATASAQARAPRPGRLSAEERDALHLGVKVELTSLATPEVIDRRDARLPALHVSAGQAPSPYLPAEPFRAVFTGYLKLPLRGEYQFSFEGRGAVTLVFNGEEVVSVPQGDLSTAKPAVAELVKGYNQFELTYTSPPEGDAALRLYWSSDEFPAEPVPPALWSFDGRDADWQQGVALRQGRQLFAERQCSKCHPLPDNVAKQLAAATAPMPELTSAAPSLIAAGQRFDATWLQHWITDPASLRNRTTMPRVLAHLDEKTQTQHAADIAAFLLEQQDQAFKPLAASAGDAKENVGEAIIARGEELFEDRGCIACHCFTPASDADEFNRVSLHFASQKYQVGALAAFLKSSQHYYLWSRMPQFAFDDEEAGALAAFIRKNSAGKLLPLDAAEPSAERGRKLFAEVGCASCHMANTADGAAIAAREPVTLNALDAGCLAATDEKAKTAPRFAFSDAERAALHSFLKTDMQSLAHETPAEFSRRQVTAINCKACHSRDGVDADLPYILAEFGQLGHAPEPIPELTWTGEKLRPDWTAKQFMGELAYRPRPHFHTRMPAFPTRAKLLAEGLSHEHGYAVDEDPRPKFSNELAKTGEAVAAMNSGLACHRCHAIGDKEAEAPFEARSTNLSVASERLRYPFYHRWMRDPLRIDPQTKMIKFAQDGKKTGLTTIDDGDAQRQFEAVWHYLQTLAAEKPPK